MTGDLPVTTTGQMTDLPALQAALDEFSRQIDELTTAGIPWDEALRHLVNRPRWPDPLASRHGE
jgi:hypothetical protein